MPSTMLLVLTLSVLFGALILLGIVGNVLVCIAIYTHRALRKKENLYFVSLAGADLLLCLTIMPFSAANDIAGRWLFGDYCRFWISFDIMFCTASNLNLCAISVDRLCHIRDPMRYDRRMSVAKILGVIGVVWFLAAALAFLPPSLGLRLHRNWRQQLLQNLTELSEQPNDDDEQVCVLDFEPYFAVLSSVVSFHLPCSIMMIAYAKLYAYARRHARNIWHQLRTVTTFLVHVASQQSYVVGEMQQRRCRLGGGGGGGVMRKDYDTKARVTLGAIFGAFITSWMPFFVFNIIRSFCGQRCVPNQLFTLLTWMGYANSAQNPVVYSLFNKDFRRAFRKILRLHKPVKPGSPDYMKIKGHNGALPPVSTKTSDPSLLFLN